MNKIIRKDLAKSILGREVYSDLLSWLDDIRQYRADYTVFVVRRSFVLVQILTDIWEQETGETLDDFSYITDAAILTVCDQIADFYMYNGCFPSIMLCDDILIHGRNINNLIADIENRIKLLLPDEEERFLLYELERAMRISVYTCSKDGVLLDKRYEPFLRMYRKEDSAFLHVLSSNISTLILNSEVANASYVYSASFEKDEFLHSIMDHGWVKTNYQNTEQYSLVVPVTNEYDAISMLYSYTATVKGQRMEFVPFVFLPQISAEETAQVYEDIVQRMKYKGYRRDYIGIVKKLYAIEGKRTFYELVSMIHSGALMNDFLKSYNVNYRNSYHASETKKLSRNYFMGAWELTRDFVEELVANPIIVDQDDLKRHIGVCIFKDTYIIEKRIHDALRHASENESSTIIMERLENQFFWQGMKEEIEAKKALNSPSVRAIKKMKRTLYGCPHIIAALVSETKNLSLTMAYFRQMMDAGVIGISSNGGTEEVVDGFCQFEKAGEQSLLTQPLRNIEYIAFLNLLCDLCKKVHLDEKLILNEFCMKYGLEEEYNQIELFLDILHNMGQYPGDWMGDYGLRIREGERSEILERRRRYLKLFEKFIAETPRNYFIKRGRINNEEDKNR